MLLSIGSGRSKLVCMLYTQYIIVPIEIRQAAVFTPRWKLLTAILPHACTSTVRWQLALGCKSFNNVQCVYIAHVDELIEPLRLSSRMLSQPLPNGDRATKMATRSRTVRGGKRGNGKKWHENSGKRESDSSGLLGVHRRLYISVSSFLL